MTVFLPGVETATAYGCKLVSYHRCGEDQSRVDLDLPVALILFTGKRKLKFPGPLFIPDKSAWPKPPSGAMVKCMKNDSSGAKAMQSNLGASRMTSATLLSRALQSKGRDLPPEGARFILDLGIMEDDKKRMLELLAKQQAGRITAQEREDLESYVQADNILSILKAQAILALKKAGQEP
jgi:hypothetical protein